jgi:hypothetical protein
MYVYGSPRSSLTHDVLIYTLTHTYTHTHTLLVGAKINWRTVKEEAKAKKKRREMEWLLKE